jgi:pyruvate,orthophosphate dikinase
MIPLVGSVREFNPQAAIVRQTAEAVFAERGAKVHYLVGTMIETPRAALVADSIGKRRRVLLLRHQRPDADDHGLLPRRRRQFLPAYVKLGIYDQDPFQLHRPEGRRPAGGMAAQKGRSVRPDIELGVCGEHGGDPASIGFFHKAGLDYVSCSPFRVPIARLAAAQAAVG